MGFPAIMMAAAAAVSTVGALQQGAAASASANYNATIANQNASIAEQQGQVATDRQRRAGEAMLGQMESDRGASGISNEGSPMDLFAENARNAEMDVLNTKYNYDLQARGYANRANLYTSEASNDMTAGYFNAAGSAASGAGRAYYYSQPQAGNAIRYQ